MGLDIDVSLLLGVLYDDVVDVTAEFQQQTKYNCDTGQPYQYNKKLDDVYHVGGNCFNADWELESFLDKNNLSIFDDDEEDDNKIIGVTIGSLGQDGGRIASGFSNPILVQYVVDKQLEISNIFTILGIKDIVPRLFLWSRVSC